MTIASRFQDAARALLRLDDDRADAGTSFPSTTAGAAISNVVSGIGTARDSGTTGRPNTQRRYLTEDELVTAFRGTIYRRLCTLLPMWAIGTSGLRRR